MRLNFEKINRQFVIIFPSVLLFADGNGLTAVKGSAILVGDFNTVMTKADNVSGMDNVFVNLLVVEEGAVGAIQICNIGSIEVSKKSCMMGADTLVSDVDIVVFCPSKTNGAWAKF